MADYTTIIETQVKKLIENCTKLQDLEENFRTYTFERGLSEDNYRVAAKEYSEAIKLIKEEVTEIGQVIEDLNAVQEIDTESKNTKFANIEDEREFNKSLGVLWRIIIMNETFCKEYGGIQLTDEPYPNLYKEIYDKHLEEVKEFMYDFIRIANAVFSK